jgi:hypothetical protein
MKFDDINNILLILCVFVPGFIFDMTLANFFRQREKKSKEILLLYMLTASAINYVVCLPIIYYLIDGIFFNHPVIVAALWFFIIFCMPVILALLVAKLLQKNIILHVAKLLGLPYVNHILTGWDKRFGNMKSCYMVVTLKDGTEVAGYFGDNSLSSSLLEHKDIYLQKTYTLSDKGVWTEVDETDGLWINGEEIAFIEFVK